MNPSNLPHYALIRSTYSDSQLSRDRLDITKLTLAPCLKHQRTPFTAVVLVNREDPYLSERIALFQQSCQSVVFLESKKPSRSLRNLPVNHAGRDETLAVCGTEMIEAPFWSRGIETNERRLVTRVDDDDIIAGWMTERLQRAAADIDKDSILYWPNGYVLSDQLRWRTSETNQFQTLLTSSPNTGLTPFAEHHARVRGRWPVITVDEARAWCWVQHPDAKTWNPDRKRVGRIEERPTRHFPADLSALRRHLSGQPLTAYQQALNKWTLTVGRPSMTITPKLWQTIRNIVRPGMKTLECGSGLSTVLFDRLTDNHVALEHDAEWADVMSPISQSVHLSSIDQETGWYASCPPGPFDFLLIDGPTGRIGRSGILPRLKHMIHGKTVIVVDDTHREPESNLSARICHENNLSSERTVDAGKSFDVLRR